MLLVRENILLTFLRESSLFELIHCFLLPGEKLSKQQLHNSNIIKKLRTKDKENENIIAKLNKKVQELEEELQHLKQVNINRSLQICCCYFQYE